MSLRQQRRTLWNWLLDKGLLISFVLVNIFAIIIGIIVLTGVFLFVRFWDKFR